MVLEDIVDTSFLYQPYISIHGMKGLYIVFEGINGSGKTTQAKLIVPYLEKLTGKEVVYTREPGARDINNNIQSNIAEDARKFVQGTDYKGLHDEMMEVMTEFLGYSASRTQTLPNIVLPVLKRSGIVVADRSFISSAAFQGHAKGLSIETVIAISKLVVQGVEPDYIFYIDLKPEIALTRMGDLEGDKHEKEGPEYHQKTDEGYAIMSKMPYFKDRWVPIDGTGTKQEVHKRVVKEINGILRLT